MKFTTLFAVLTALAASSSSVLALPTNDHVLHESRSHLPSGWTQRARLPPTERFTMRFGLKQSNMDRLDDILMAISDPSSPTYGQHMTPNEVIDTFAPSDETVSTVRDWLVAAGIKSDRIKHTANKLWLEIDVAVHEAESLLKSEYGYYEHAQTGTGHVATTAYHLPQGVSSHVDIVTPTIHFDVPLRDRDFDEVERDQKFGKRADTAPVKNGNAQVKNIIGKGQGNPGQPKIGASLGQQLFTQLQNCDTTITPICLYALYKFAPEIQPKSAAAKNSIGIVEYSPVYVLQSDTTKFIGNYSQNVPKNYQPGVVLIDGAQEVQDHTLTGNAAFAAYGEGNLDTQYAVALSYPTPVTIYQVGPSDGSASFNTFLDGVDGSYCTYEGGDDYTMGDPHTTSCGTAPKANVFSTSYAYNEADLSPAYEARQCSEYAKLGMQGVSFLFSSGDYGVGGNSGQCIDPTTGAYNDGTSGMFNPSFPGTCPYITSVGATQVNPGSSVLAPESACEQVIYSGGGFSNNFALPSYQAAAVTSWFKNHPPPYGADRFNNTGKSRGFPDISANGANYAVSIEGTYYKVFGTSASCPVVSSIITNLNTARIAVGKGPLGFLNPWLYKNPGMLNDITSGGNQGCGTPGFTAVTGWDPVTGLGTPNYPKMLVSALAQA